MNDITEKIVGIIVGAIASGVVSYVIAGFRARVVSAEEAGRYKAEFEHLKRTVEAQNEVLHDRVTKVSQALTATLEKLDARTIEILEKHAELRGILIGKREIE
jgi:ABC-type anion transport system duplicated permease subunit